MQKTQLRCSVSDKYSWREQKASSARVYAAGTVCSPREPEVVSNWTSSKTRVVVYSRKNSSRLDTNLNTFNILTHAFVPGKEQKSLSVYFTANVFRVTGSRQSTSRTVLLSRHWLVTRLFRTTHSILHSTTVWLCNYQNHALAQRGALQRWKCMSCHSVKLQRSHFFVCHQEKCVATSSPCNIYSPTRKQSQSDQTSFHTPNRFLGQNAPCGKLH